METMELLTALLLLYIIGQSVYGYVSLIDSIMKRREARRMQELAPEYGVYR